MKTSMKNSRTASKSNSASRSSSAKKPAASGRANMKATSATRRPAAKSTAKTTISAKTVKGATSSKPVSRSMNTLSSIPKPAPNAKKITAVVRKSGKTMGYKLADGTVLNKVDAIKLAKKGGILGVGIAKRNGTEYLKTLPDGSSKQNLGALPRVSN